MPEDNGRVTPATQEIRLATTMTGGVSLAIWMGGVARELNLLAQASRWRSALTIDQELPSVTEGLTETEKVRLRYLQLIQLLDVTVDIDILSGTSAGGINAALLAYSRVAGKDLGGLRELWLDLGALLSLMRDPADSNVPSLLLGDAQMLAQLARRLPLLGDAPSGAKPDEKALTTLFVTTTLLTGETSRFTDAYGTLVQDVDHHGLFRFTENQLTEGNTGALALAARSSASFPGAFEPSFIPFTTPTPADGTIPERPAMAAFSDITRSHWAADGGVLDNQPIGPLLQTVFDRGAERLVRRVLLYVVPSTGTAPDLLKQQAGDDVSKPYGLLEGLLRDIGAVKSQSIAADLRAIRDHNDRVAVRTDTRLQLATLAADLKGPLLTESLLADYCARQAQTIAQQVTDALMRQITTWPADSGGGASKSSIPREWQDALTPGSAADQICRDEIVVQLSTRWGQAVPAGFAALTGFDRPAYDGAKAVALSVFRAVYPLAFTPALQRQLAVCIKAVHDAFRAPPRPDLRQLVGTWGETQAIRDMKLKDAAARMAVLYLEKLAEARPEPASTPSPAGVRPAAARQTGTSNYRFAEAWQKLGEVFTLDATRDLFGKLTRDGSGGAAAGATNDRLSGSKKQLRIYLAYLHIDDGADRIAARLFALFAAQRAMLPAHAEVEQRVELIQLSADTRTSLDPNRSTAASKLTGEQLHHFGAFFKQSWRANDWMWGRLDGAGWLVHLLLDPRRIQAVASSLGDRKVDWFLTELEKLGAVPLATGNPGDRGIQVTPDGSSNPVYINQATIRDELAFLDKQSLRPPASLPLTAMWVAREWQLHIAAEELPTMAQTVTAPNNNGTESRPADEYKSATEVAWANDVTQAENTGKLLDKAGDLLRSNPVPDEKLSGEIGSPLMIRTVAKAAATATGAVNSVKQIPSVVRPATSWARTVSLGGYRLTTKIKPVPRWLITVGLVFLAIGVLAAIQQSTLLGFAGLVLASIGAYLIVFGAWQMSPLVLGALLSTTIVLAVGALTVPTVRRQWTVRHLGQRHRMARTTRLLDRNKPHGIH